MLLAGKECREAEALFRIAMGVAIARGGKSWELRAANSLARLMLEQGRHDEARAIIEPVYSFFTEGFATGDLREAKALLDQALASERRRRPFGVVRGASFRSPRESHGASRRDPARRLAQHFVMARNHQAVLIAPDRNHHRAGCRWKLQIRDSLSARRTAVARGAAAR